ncbi:hypothetical protein K445DRAFT_18492 [Daldinia sp. EC12]|nr:hypothetical protein K445DRAFT_18492 [Daldinia sp. EC12]
MPYYSSKPLNEPYREPAYPYRKLEGTDIRLLRILPGTGTEDIVCLLHQMPLEEAGDFYSLSYVWGDPTDLYTIILENQFFEVRINLARALHQFRELSSGVGSPGAYIWIDAICIDQDNIDERSQQVQRMIDIYNRGNTIVWLGPIVRLYADRHPTLSHKCQMSSDEAFEFLFEKINSIWTGWIPPNENSDTTMNKMLGHAYKVVMDMMTDILQRPWFERIWTLQEACLDANPTVYVGRHSTYIRRLISFAEEFARWNRILHLLPGYKRGIAIQNINDLQQDIYDDEDDSPRKLKLGEVLVKIIRIAGAAKSMLPHDQIYGLLGILKYLKGEELPDDLLPNYHASYTEMYWNYAALCFQSIGDLHLLDYARNELQGVPSWVPDFRYVTAGPSIPEPSVYVTPDKRSLHIQGHILGTPRNVFHQVKSKDIMPRREKIPVELTNLLKAFEEHILKPSACTREITIERVFDEMMEYATTIMRVDRSASFYEIYSTLRDSLRTRRSRTAKKRRTRSIGLKEEAIAHHFSMPHLLLHDGTILTTDRDDINVRNDDLICLFKESGQAGLLRASGESFTFLSLCRVRCGPLKRKQEERFWLKEHIQDLEFI